MTKLPYDDLFIREAIDTGLSRVRFTQRNKNEVWMRIEGGKPVKKKLSLALVLAIALALVAVTALAVTVWKNYYDTVAQKEYTDGYFIDWSAEDKVAFIDLLIENGTVFDAGKVTKLHDAGVSEVEKSRIAEELVTEKFGEPRQGKLEIRDMISAEIGELFEFWPLELKAKLSELQSSYDPYYQRWYGKSLVPGEGDLSESDATAIARGALKDTYGLSDADIDALKLSVAFYDYADTEDDPLIRAWLFEFYTKPPEPGVAGEAYFVWLSADGEVTGTDDNVTDEAEIVPEEMVGIAERFLAWQYISQVGREKAIKMDVRPDIVVPDINLFTVEGFALFAREWAQPMKAAGRGFLGITEIPYALPDADSILQEEALAIANAAMMGQLGGSGEILAYYGNPSISYRVYDVEHPVWRVGYFFNIKSEERLRLHDLARKGDIPWGGSVYIDAKTGEIQSVRQYDEFFANNWFGEYEPGEFDHLLPEPEAFG
ncbi:MAG: PepSY domain-containing protein [Oscillospiraceae bacterium]|jgi:hypothetical protein|nr:PepSY domain-containing protein [Oscillospiraceae bacterium]